MKTINKFNNKYYRINLIEESSKSISYVISRKNSKLYKVGVVDSSEESIDDYIDCQTVFLRSHGKTARRWLNRILRPYFKECGFDSEILYQKLKKKED